MPQHSGGGWRCAIHGARAPEGAPPGPARAAPRRLRGVPAAAALGGTLAYRPRGVGVPVGEVKAVRVPAGTVLAGAVSMPPAVGVAVGAGDEVRVGVPATPGMAVSVGEAPGVGAVTNSPAGRL